MRSTTENLYIIDPIITCIGGKSTVTESELRINPGTLPPEDVASRPSLKLLPQSHLKPFRSIKTSVIRECSSSFVKCGLGMIATETSLPEPYSKLEQFRQEYYRHKDQLIKDWPSIVGSNAYGDQGFQALIKQHAPSIEHVIRRIQFDINVVPIAKQVSDSPYAKSINETFNRLPEIVSENLLDDIAGFINKLFIDPSGPIIKEKINSRNLDSIAKHCLQKLSGYIFLDPSVEPISNQLSQLVDWARASIDSKPKSASKSLSPKEFSIFRDGLSSFRSKEGIKDIVKFPISKNLNWCETSSPSISSQMSLITTDTLEHTQPAATPKISKPAFPINF